MSTFVRTRYQTKFSEPTKTQQCFKDQCSMKQIIQKAKKFGLPQPTNKGFFGDFSGIDFQGMQNLMCQANEGFMALHPSIRRRFHNNPQELIDFIDNDENRAEAEKLGLVQIKEPEKVPVPVPLLDVTGTSDTKAVTQATTGA